MISKVYSKNGYDVFEQCFKSREDFISYLKSARETLTFVNRELASKIYTNDYKDWYKTKSFEEALNLFEYGWYEDFDLFLSQKKKIDKFFPYVAKKKIYQNYVCGSVPNVVNAINNLPLTMRKTFERNVPQKIIKINYNFSYPHYTKKEQVLNNGLLTLSLIDFFDSLGYRVDLNFYSLLKSGNQILYVDTKFKSSGEKINLQKFYFAFCNPSFLRRLIFRVIESTNGLDAYWVSTYGLCMRVDEIKEILDIDENNIFINWPDQMGVKGEDVEEDIRRFLDTISLGKYIEVNDERFDIVDNKEYILKVKR